MPLYAHIKTDRVDGWFRILDKNVVFNDETDEDVKAEDLAFNRDIEDDESAIYFACAVSPITQDLTDVANVGIEEPTEVQRQWLKTYKHQLSPNQREDLADWL